MSHIYPLPDEDNLITFIADQVVVLQDEFVSGLARAEGNDEALLRSFTSGKALMLARLQREFIVGISYDVHLMLLNLLANYVVYN